MAIKVIHIMRSIGPTSMPWNDLYCSIRTMSPGIVYRPMAITRIFGGRSRKVERCAGRAYQYIDSSVTSSLCEVRRIYRRSSKKSIKLAVHVHNPSLCILVAPLKLLCPGLIVIVNLHNDWRFFKVRQRVCLKILAKLSDHFITVSHAIKSTIPKRIANDLSLDGKLSAIPNGIRPNDFTGFNDNGRSNTMVMVALMVPQKNCFFAIDILANSKCVEKLIWIGNGKQREKIIEYAEKLGVISRLNLLGVVDREEVYDVLINSSVYIAPSLWEGIGVANLEAAALGCIPFLSDIPPHQEIASNIGIKTYPLDDVQLWANSIDSLLSVPSEEIQTKREKLRYAAMNNYNLNNKVGEYIGIYDKLDQL